MVPPSRPHERPSSSTRRLRRIWILAFYAPLMLLSPLPGKDLLFHAHGDAGHHVHSMSPTRLAGEHVGHHEHGTVHDDESSHDHSDHDEHDGSSSATPAWPSSQETGVVLSTPTLALNGTRPASASIDVALHDPAMGSELVSFAHGARHAHARPGGRGFLALDRGSGVLALLRSSHALLI